VSVRSGRCWLVVAGSSVSGCGVWDSRGCRSVDMPVRGFVVGEFDRVVLPSGEQVWVRPVAVSGGEGAGSTRADVSLGGAVAQLAQVPGFVETVRGVVDSVRLALDRHRPDRVEVEFGLEISGKTGVALGVLGQAGGAVHVKITAGWGGGGGDGPAGG
jgi:Trypsin-co-occurring domain 1